MEAFEPAAGYYRLKVDGEWVDTQAVIIASGASAKWLGLENESQFKGHGLTSCATSGSRSRGATRECCSDHARSTMMPSAMMDAMMSGQMGQPAAEMMANKDALLSPVPGTGTGTHAWAPARGVMR